MRYQADRIRRLSDGGSFSEHPFASRATSLRVFYDIQKEVVRGSVRAGQRILEIGAGYGEFTSQLLDQGAHVVVTDLCEKQLESNRRRLLGHPAFSNIEAYSVTDVCDLSSFESGAFDGVVALGGPISYTLDSKRIALREVRRVLRAGGTALFGVMNLWGTIRALNKHFLTLTEVELKSVIQTGDMNEKLVGRGLHPVHMFTPNSLIGELTAADFVVRKLTTTNFLSLEPCDDIEYEALLAAEIQSCSEPHSLNAGDQLIAEATAGFAHAA